MGLKRDGRRECGDFLISGRSGQNREKVEVQVIKMARRAIFDSIDLVKWGRRLILLKQSASGQSVQFKRIRVLYSIIFVKFLSNVLIRLTNN